MSNGSDDENGGADENGGDGAVDVTPGYDPRTDPDSEHYDPEYDPETDPWNDPDYDPFDKDFDPETGERIPVPDPSGPDAEDKTCLDIDDCELLEIEDMPGQCCFVCRAKCSDGTELTDFFCDYCDDASE